MINDVKGHLTAQCTAENMVQEILPWPNQTI